MMIQNFHHIRQWVFDLDNTLYDPKIRLFDQIEVKMTEWIMNFLHLSKEDAAHLRARYWRKYGTTLAGLMHEHQADPGDYLEKVHDIDFGVLPPNPVLAAALHALPGHKIIYTNGSVPYARSVIQALGIHDCFDAVYGVEDADFHPKPSQSAFETVFAKAGITPAIGVMFEDDPRNLAVPHQMGLRTVLVGPAPHKADHIHYHTADLEQFLQQCRS